MKHKLICLILCLLLLPSLFLSVGAEQQYVIDNADLMSSSEEAALEEKAQALRQEYGMDVVILTVDSLDGKRPQDYADDYYDYNGYADDGVLFLLSMEERDWYISTKGNAIYALTDYGIQQVGESALPYLKNGDYYGAFDAFLAALPTYFSAYNDGTPIDGTVPTSGDYYHGMRACMNTKRPQRSAGSYLNDSSYHLRTNRDLFLYSNVTKTRIQQESSSSGGGGSSVHTSSSGSTHGGGGGKF